MAIYYHVSCDINHTGKFVPRVPEFRDDCEDSYTKRVCVAPSIEQCLTSMPGGSSYLTTTCVEDTDYFFKVFKIDTEKLGINPSDIIFSETLFKNDCVYDANITGECWVTVPFQVPEEDAFAILLQEWKTAKLYAYPFSFYERINKWENFDGDLLKAYKNEYQGTPEVVWAITDLEYIPQKIKNGACFKWNVVDEDEKRGVVGYFMKHWDVELVRTEQERILFEAHQPISLIDLANHYAKYYNSLYIREA